jgi:hypothetical protein
VSDWLLYDDIVDLVRSRHHGGHSGLLTGVTERQHSFQIGFDKGNIVLLTYRIRKGLAALQLISQIERAKITEYPVATVTGVSSDVPDTSAILSRLTSNTQEDVTSITEISEVPSPLSEDNSGQPRALDAKMRTIIEAAAVHHFGPIGAMVCEEHLSDAQADVRQLMLEIANDVGASEDDTRSFFNSVSNG